MSSSGSVGTSSGYSRTTTSGDESSPGTESWSEYSGEDVDQPEPSGDDACLPEHSGETLLASPAGSRPLPVAEWSGESSGSVSSAKIAEIGKISIAVEVVAGITCRYKSRSLRSLARKCAPPPPVMR